MEPDFVLPKVGGGWLVYNVPWGLNWCPGPGLACTLSTSGGDPTVSSDSKSATMGDV